MTIPFTPENARRAVANCGTVFFNGNFEPLEPRDGQWFCEFNIELSDEGNEILLDGALVEYVGEGRVLEEGYDCDRLPYADILILQN